MKVIIKLIFYVCALISAGAVFIGLIYLVVNGLDVFMQYRLYMLSKSLTYGVIGVMVLCVIKNYFARNNQNEEEFSLLVQCPFSYITGWTENIITAKLGTRSYYAILHAFH
jgi:hypothetical protein